MTLTLKVDGGGMMVAGTYGQKQWRVVCCCYMIDLF